MKRESWKKLAAMAMALAMVPSLAACGSASGGTSTPAASSAAASASASASSSEKTALQEKWASLAGRHIKVGTSCTQTGWSQDDGTGSPEGCDIDVMRYICDYYGLDLEWYVADYASLWGCVQNGLIDTIANLTTVNPDRLGLYWFTNTYAWESYSIASRAEDAPDDGDMAYWNGKTLCGEAGSNATLVMEDVIADQASKGNTINELVLDATTVLVPAVVQGQADGAFLPTSTCSYIVDQMGYSEQCHIQNVGWKNMPIVYGFARNDDNKDLILAINDLLEEMHSDGTLSSISQKWFGADLTGLPDGEVNYVTTTGDNAWQSYEG